MSDYIDNFKQILLGGYEKIEDMTIIGQCNDPSVFDRELTLSFGRHRADKKWPAHTCTLSDFAILLSAHKAGPKNGKAFLQGDAYNGERNAKAMVNLYLTGIDIDNGTPIQDMIETLKAWEVLAFIYSTHSHLTSTTRVDATAFVRFCATLGIDAETAPPDVMARYLEESRKLTPALAKTVAPSPTP